MATTTPNFGWPVPTSTDLVKDGATAIEGLGDAIDASLLDLKGGTTNQVLAKNSNTDMDFKWVADASGIPATIIDAKGDLIAGTAADTAARLAVGTNGQVLTADSTAATGLAWATASSGATFSGASVKRSSTQQTMSNNAYTTLSFDTENYDVDNYWTSGSPTRITIPTGKTGKHLLTFTITVDPNGTGGRIVKLQKNGTDIYYGTWAAAAPAGIESSINSSVVLNLDAADYLEVLYFQNSGGGLLTGTGAAAANLQITYLGA